MVNYQAAKNLKIIIIFRGTFSTTSVSLIAKMLTFLKDIQYRVYIKKKTILIGLGKRKVIAAMAARQTTMADEGTDVGDEVQCTLFVCKE